MPGDNRYHADVFIPMHWTGRRGTALNVTVVNYLKTVAVADTATNPGFALNYAHMKKLPGVE